MLQICFNAIQTTKTSHFLQLILNMDANVALAKTFLILFEQYLSWYVASPLCSGIKADLGFYSGKVWRFLLQDTGLLGNDICVSCLAFSCLTTVFLELIIFFPMWGIWLTSFLECNLPEPFVAWGIMLHFCLPPLQVLPLLWRPILNLDQPMWEIIWRQISQYFWLENLTHADNKIL